MIYRRYIKRILDLLITVPATIVLVPVILLLTVLIRISMGPKPIFSQERLGLNGKAFVIHKFRTMSNATDDDGNLLSDYERMTRLGSLLRKLSLDELPQLWNVLKGEMSLVGPRPLMSSYRDRYSPFQARRHEVRPGITGSAQVGGRNTLTWDEKFELDVWYVDNVSLKVDFGILMATVRKLFAANDVDAGESVTMAEFQGNAAQQSAVNLTDSPIDTPH